MFWVRRTPGVVTYPEYHSKSWVLIQWGFDRDALSCFLPAGLKKPFSKGNTGWITNSLTAVMPGHAETLGFTQPEEWLGCSESRYITSCGLQCSRRTVSLAPKMRTTERGKHEPSFPMRCSLRMMLVVQQVWEISDTWEDGWEEGRGRKDRRFEESLRCAEG